MRIAESYSVIVIPKDRSKVRRFLLTRGKILATYSFIAGFVVFTFALGIGLIHYWDSFRATKNLRFQAGQYEKERAQVLAHINDLEMVVKQNEDLAIRLETIVGIQPISGVKVGVGGIQEMPNPTPLKLAALDPLQNSIQDLEKKEGEEPSFDPLPLRAANLKTIELAEEAKDITTRLKDVYHFNADAEYFWTAMPTIAPTRGWVTSSFGVRRSPISGNRQLHEGVDIACPYDASIRATGDGVVTFADWDGGLGKKIVIDHGYGLTTVYGHNSKILVKSGDRIERNQVIAKAGSTGRSTGPHVHYEVLIDGVPVDPTRFMVERL